jgi:hypothetical protein
LLPARLFAADVERDDVERDDAERDDDERDLLRLLPRFIPPFLSVSSMSWLLLRAWRFFDVSLCFPLGIRSS